MKIQLQLGLAVSLLAGSVSGAAAELAEHTFSKYVGPEGEISLPADFRLNWSHLGSWIVDDAKAPGAGFHDVYTQPEAVEAYRETSSFPDGTVLVKEIRGIAAETLTTGPAQWATDTEIWFVMVKDDQQRFDGPHWAEGWGWALFDVKDRETNISESFAATCQGCHIPARNTDWVYIEGYPTLK